MGQSLAFKQPVFDLIMSRMPATLLLTLTSAVLALVIGTLLGVVAAQRAGGPVDSALSFRKLRPVCHALLLARAHHDRHLRLDGAGVAADRRDAQRPCRLHRWRDVLDVLQHLILPATTLALVQIPIYFRIARASVLQQQREDYVTTFRATGMPNRASFAATPCGTPCCQP
ncbi:MAG: ABC transporter permease [Thermomicrobiales bacterium]